MLRTFRAIGEIDLATVSALTADLRDTIDASDEALVSVDCSDVTFMDSSGFHVLVDATEYASRRGHTLVIRNLSPSCERLIRLCDWDRELRVETAPRTRLTENPFGGGHDQDSASGTFQPVITPVVVAGTGRVGR